MRLVPTERMSVVLVASEDIVSSSNDFCTIEYPTHSVFMWELSVLYGVYIRSLTAVRMRKRSASETVFAVFENELWA